MLWASLQCHSTGRVRGHASAQAVPSSLAVCPAGWLIAPDILLLAGPMCILHSKPVGLNMQDGCCQ